MKKSLKLAAALIASVMLFSACGKTEEATVTDNTTAVEVQMLESSSISKKVTYAGKVTANQTVNVTSKASGQVNKINFDVGDRVKKGDVLFTIDTKDINDQIKTLEASLKISQAGVNSAKTALSQSTNGGQIQTSKVQLENAVKTAQKSVDNAQVGVDNAKVTISTTKTAVDTAKANYDDLATKYQNYTTMYQQGIISKNDFDSVELGYTSAKNSYDQAQNSYSQAQLALTSAENQLEQAQTGLQQAQDSLDIFNGKTISDNKDSASDGVKTAEANRNSVETQLSVLRSQLSDYTVTSPIDGVISARNIEVTNMVSAASVPFIINDTDTVTVNVDVSESIINSINVGDSVDVSASGNDMTGTVKTVNTVAGTGGTYAIEVSVPNPDGTLKPGMFANISFVSESSNDVLVVPRDTVIEKNDETYVYVINGTTAVKRIVETGVEDGVNIEIKSGVSEGERVVVSGQSYLDDGDTVKVVSNSDNSSNSTTEEAAEVASTTEGAK
jgi:RND family efflux transporter MFP subunit